MKATINGVFFEGTPVEMAALLMENAKNSLAMTKEKAAMDCGVQQMPLFTETKIETTINKNKPEEPPSRKGKYKVVIRFADSITADLKFYNLVDFYRKLGVRKCDVAPSVKMPATDRHWVICRSIAEIVEERYRKKIRDVAVYGGALPREALL